MRKRFMGVAAGVLLATVIAGPVRPASALVPANQECVNLPGNLTWSTSPAPDASLPITVTLTSNAVGYCESVPPTLNLVASTTLPGAWSTNVNGNCALAMGGDASTGYFDLFIGNVAIWYSLSHGIGGTPGKGAGVSVGYPSAGLPCRNTAVTFTYTGVAAGT